MTNLTPFVLSVPAIGSTDVSITPILSWTAYKGAKWYEVTVSEGPSFVIPEWSHNVYNLFYGVEEPLKYGTTYYWRVRGVTATPYVRGTAIITPSGPWQVSAFTTKLEPLPTTKPVGKVQPAQVFLSHTQRDVDVSYIFCDACELAGVKPFMAEFEPLGLPAWKTIRDEIRKSRALFFVIGKELVGAQDSSDPSWHHTQSWIAYEIGVACEREKDVWVICDDTKMNFPVPYLNNYLPITLENKQSFDYLVYILKRYAEGETTNFPREGFVIQCRYNDCKATYNLHMKVDSDTYIRCPQCLRRRRLRKGWPEVK